MKWFGNKPLSSDPIELACQCVDYLQKSGELIEREAAVKILLEVVREHEIPSDVLRCIVDLGYPEINYWLAIHGSERVIDILLDTDIVEQGIIANILSNPNLMPRHKEPLDKKIDDSLKGNINRQLWTRI